MRNSLISPVQSLRFSLIKTSKPAIDFWNKLKVSLKRKFVVMAVNRAEDDREREGLGYALVRVEEVDHHRLIGIGVFIIGFFLRNVAKLLRKNIDFFIFFRFIFSNYMK